MRKKVVLDLGCGGGKMKSEDPNIIVFGLDQHRFDGVDVICDLNEGIPYEAESADVILARHFLEHLSDPIKIMNEIWRVLRMGGEAHVIVPSTDGPGAFQDPTHKSFWNENSFLYYSHPTYQKLYPDLIKCNFTVKQLQVTKAVTADEFKGVVVVAAVLIKQPLQEESKNERIQNGAVG